jgi:hypothetical protein
MSLKIKSRSTGEKASGSTVEPPALHDVTNQKASAKPASRRPLIATQPASGAANHARHHVSKEMQA